MALSTPTIRTGVTACATLREAEVLTEETRLAVNEQMAQTAKRMPAKTTAYNFHSNQEGVVEVDVVGKGNRRDIAEMEAFAKDYTRRLKLKNRLRNKLVAKGVKVAEHTVTWTGAGWG